MKRDNKINYLLERLGMRDVAAKYSGIKFDVIEKTTEEFYFYDELVIEGNSRNMMSTFNSLFTTLFWNTAYTKILDSQGYISQPLYVHTE